MSGSRHTRGPWAVDDKGGRGPGPEITAENGSASIALVNGQLDTCVANANLIAAAPELLTMVRALHYSLALATTGYHYKERLDLGTVERDGAESILEAARELVARAEGRET